MIKFLKELKINKEPPKEFIQESIYDSCKRTLILLCIVGLSQILFILFELVSNLPWDVSRFYIRLALTFFCIGIALPINILCKSRGQNLSYLKFITSFVGFVSIISGSYFVVYMFESGIYSYSSLYIAAIAVSIIYVLHPFVMSIALTIAMFSTTIYLSIYYSPISYWLGEFLIALVIMLLLSVYNIQKYNQRLKQYLNEDNMKKEVALLASELSKQQKMEAIGVLASGVAHEINNPINGILNYGQIILDDEMNEINPKEYAKEIIHETNRVAEIVRNLLSFSRNEAEEHSYADISDIISKTMSLIRTVIKHDQIELNVYIETNLPQIKCRSQQIQQVILNLLTNAHDALNEKYPTYNKEKVINLSCIQQDIDKRKYLKLIVEDFGLGIPENIKDKIFDPFYTSKRADKGTGLGLSISHRIIKEHHGEIIVETEINKFTRFILLLPCDNGWELNK